MKTSLVRIGNSQGVRIPKAIIEQCGLTAEVDLSVKGGAVVIAASRKPRAGWAEAFKRMAEAGDDALLIPDDLPNEFDEKEWTW
jgi:antitoxin MazE